MRRITITAALIAGSLATAVQAQDREGKYPQAARDFEDCVIAAATYFESAGEPVADTIEVAFVKCASERNSVRLAMNPGDNPTTKAFVEKVISSLSNDLRARLMVMIFEKRAQRSGSPR